MAMPDYPPYTYIQDGTYHGFGYEAFISIMADLRQDFIIVPEPNYGRAVRDMQSQVVDGMFLASENEDCEQSRLSFLLLLLTLAGPGSG